MVVWILRVAEPVLRSAPARLAVLRRMTGEGLLDTITASLPPTVSLREVAGPRNHICPTAESGFCDCAQKDGMGLLCRKTGWGPEFII